MDQTVSLSASSIFQEDFFQFVKPEEFSSFGIDEEDVPLGTFVALRHPPRVQSRFGGNAYGLGLYEARNRLDPEGLKLLSSVAFDDPEDVKAHYKELNEIYKRLGLLVRFSRSGKPYYLIPAHLVSSTILHIRAKFAEIAKTISFHKKRSSKEQLFIGVIAEPNELITSELPIQFKEHSFVFIDSFQSLRDLHHLVDLVFLTKDIYETVLMEGFIPPSIQTQSKRILDKYAVSLLWRLYNVLKDDGELFVLGDYRTARSNRTVEVTFKTTREAKQFLLFTHIFKTRKRYRLTDLSAEINLFDFQRYLIGPYVGKEVVDRLLGDRNLDQLSIKEINNLPYLNYTLNELPLYLNQEKTWARLMGIFFKEAHLRSTVPQIVKENWEERFSCSGYEPAYMMTFLGFKRPLRTTYSEIIREVMESNLVGCPLSLVAEYRNSFEYIIRALKVLKALKNGSYAGLPQVFIDRLRLPLKNKSRRHLSLNYVLELISKLGRLERIKEYLTSHDDNSRPNLLENIEILNFFGFRRNEMKELAYIVLGHTTMGRVSSGKMNEKSLKPLSDLARKYNNLEKGLNLLRYCRLMTMAEMEASRGKGLDSGHLLELFSIYELTVRVVTNRNLDWEKLLDEQVSYLGGIHNKIVRKVLKIMNYFEFLDNWAELASKGRMEKESLADYDEEKLHRIENVIRLVNTLEELERPYLNSDPLGLSALYRKFLEIEFHGTGRIFERLDGRNVFILLWITVHVARGGIINFNPILGNMGPAESEEHIRRLGEEASSINLQYLDNATLKRFGDEIYGFGSSYVMGTGFQLRIDFSTGSLEVDYMDLDSDIAQAENLSAALTGMRISEIPEDDLELLETLFSNLESFYQSNLRLEGGQAGYSLKIPKIQKHRFQRVSSLRRYLAKRFTGDLFDPEELYTNIEILNLRAPSLLGFLLPELTSLKDMHPGEPYQTNTTIFEHTLISAKRFQALVRRDEKEFQEVQSLHILARREFGPMATGTLGPTGNQLRNIEDIIDRLKGNQSLFGALTRAILFKDFGRIQGLREKHRGLFNPVDIGSASAFFLEKEGIPDRFQMPMGGKNYFIFLSRYHNYLLNIIRGERPLSALQDLIALRDRETFEAFFVVSFVILSALKEDLIVEDMVDRIFNTRDLCLKIIDGKTTFEHEFEQLCSVRGSLFHALASFQARGEAQSLSPSEFLKLEKWNKLDRENLISAGRMVFGMERLLRLCGVINVEFNDLVRFMVKDTIRHIYESRNFSSTGYASFEKDIFEALRIYNTFQNIPEPIRHFVLQHLVDHNVNIFGYEKIGIYLTYANEMKLLLIGLISINRLDQSKRFKTLDFLRLSQEIDKRYEALNAYLNDLSVQRLWEQREDIEVSFKGLTGISFSVDKEFNIVSLNFHDGINISRKVAHLEGIDDPDELKEYFHSNLHHLRKHPFYTEDYEIEMEKAFEKRLHKIADNILTDAERRMRHIEDFEKLQEFVTGLSEYGLELPFSSEQEDRLNDLYVLRKDNLKRQKLLAIDRRLSNIEDQKELNAYWDGIKSYLKSNRDFLGKEIEALIARKFDDALIRIGGAESK